MSHFDRNPPDACKHMHIFQIIDRTVTSVYLGHDINEIYACVYMHQVDFYQNDSFIKSNNIVKY